MAFFEERFPEYISLGAEGGPRFITSKAYMQGGQRISNREATHPLHEYSIAHPVKDRADFEALRAFFYVVGGDADAFRFKDWADFRATQANSSLSLISSNVYQLNRLYTYGSRTYVRPIYKPVASIAMYRTRSGVTTLATADASVNYTTGRVTVSNHVSGDTYTWVGEFDVPVAFKDPGAMWRLLGTQDELIEWPSIELEEIRV